MTSLRDRTAPLRDSFVDLGRCDRHGERRTTTEGAAWNLSFVFPLKPIQIP
jgi:hypothetical protein